ncbi:hypothetical protein [Pelagerythrobacter sp.]|uniref:hypothetical protein n=1 Tax=Pelagerythrobacter sp. TaxID=2800702 RepID=UPI0035B42D09
MPKIKPHVWAFAVMAVAVLNILDVLPDWTTIAAILTIPLLATSCGNRRDAERAR